MVVGYWNKSVILTYLAIIFSALGITLLIISKDNINYSICCLMLSGILDLFDGVVARKCKRTNAEKNFGIQLDSLADVFNFVAYPFIILLFINEYKIISLLVGCFYSICGIARLAFFNTIADNDNPVKYYFGLPVTFVALIIPFIYLLNLVLSINIFSIIYLLVMFIVGVLFILKIKIPKPKGVAYIFFSILLLIMLTVYLFI